LFASAAIHGDEINGVEIVRRLLKVPDLARIRGTVIAVPVVNVFGFVGRTRYLPDRRDLNRSFPGSPSGSLASQLAHLFMTEVVIKCSHGIDLHSGAVHRTNLPQLRADLSNPEAERLARLFGVPVILNARLRDGSLRQAAAEIGIPILLYEAGEALRFDELAIRAGVKGLVRLMRALGMIRQRKPRRPILEPVVVRASSWVRAPAGGILRSSCALGMRLKAGDTLGVIADPFGEAEATVTATKGGILIGRTNLPVVNQGDGLFHIAQVTDADMAAEMVEVFHDRLGEELPAPEGEWP
jgi:predicted deacylase